MVYRRHFIGMILRLFVILGVMVCVPLCISLVEPGQLIFTLLVIGLMLVALVLELYFYMNRTLRELTQFLEHIRNRDFNLRFNEKESRGDRKDLYRTFNEVLEVYREIRIEREVHFRFLEHMVELIEVGIIVFDQDGRVVLWNTAATNLTGIPALGSWDQLVRKNEEFALQVGSIHESGRMLLEPLKHGSSGRLVVQVSRTRMLEESYSLMAIQDISSVVDHKETGAWIRLLRTLNHEIKNSVTPISSLADTIMMILKREGGQYKSVTELEQENLEDIITSVETLQQRSLGLRSFIDEYHRLTRIPAPDPVSFSCASLFREIKDTFKSELDRERVRLVIGEGTTGMEIRADRALIGQAMINLVRNSLDALSGHAEAEIHLSCKALPEELQLSVSDNGTGIDEDLMEDIFTPFFTTKTGGSGIGLSLVRQIMRLHGGQLKINSNKGKGTTVCLVFPVRSNLPPIKF
jgi:nitrogen fixation/metabolism regulation signal transduction histidine kinase